MAKYSEEFKRDAVALVRQGATQREVGRDLGVSKSALSKWVADADRRDAGLPVTKDVSPMEDAQRRGVSGGQPISYRYSFDSTTTDALGSYADKLPKGLLPKTDALRAVQESTNTDTRVQGRGVLLQIHQSSSGESTVTLTWVPPSRDGCGRGQSHPKVYEEAGLQSPYVGPGDLCLLTFRV